MKRTILMNIHIWCKRCGFTTSSKRYLCNFHTGKIGSNQFLCQGSQLGNSLSSLPRYSIYKQTHNHEIANSTDHVSVTSENYKNTFLNPPKLDFVSSVTQKQQFLRNGNENLRYDISHNEGDRRFVTLDAEKPCLEFTEHHKLIFHLKKKLSLHVGPESKQSSSLALGEEEIAEEVDIFAASDSVVSDFTQTPLPPASLSLSSYVEHSETLQKLVQIGVDLSRVERRPEIAQKILQMNFETDIQEKLFFLTNLGVPGERLGEFLTKNPMILDESMHNLQVRIQYLRSKKFSEESIAKIVSGAPYFLLLQVNELDSKLGSLQRNLQLTGSELRAVVTRTPKIVTFKEAKITENLFILRKQFGFRPAEMKELILKEPRILLRGKYKLIGIFDYAHNMMEVPHSVLIQNAEVFHCRVYKLEERHKFLKSLGRAQYNPKLPNYISLQRLCLLPDDVFCTEMAKSSLEVYNKFLHTL